jgi:hypothetical protein
MLDDGTELENTQFSTTNISVRSEYEIAMDSPGGLLSWKMQLVTIIARANPSK